MQEDRVESATHSLIATEAEGNVGDAATDLAARAHVLNLTRGTDEVHSIVVVLCHAGTNGEDVGVEDYVLHALLN